MYRARNNASGLSAAPLSWMGAQQLEYGEPEPQPQADEALAMPCSNNSSTLTTWRHVKVSTGQLSARSRSASRGWQAAHSHKEVPHIQIEAFSNIPICKEGV